MFLHVKRFHMVGIGGSGMSGIAQVLRELGFSVTGSDRKNNEAVEHLKKLDISVSIGHAAQNVGQADVVVRSTAVSDQNEEIVEARKRNIPVISRGEMLGELTRMGDTFAVAGTHGKTTTTTMVSGIVTAAGLDPTVIIGGRVRSSTGTAGSGARLGKFAEGKRYFVVESDESDGSFLKLNPALAIVTNIDTDHLDYYGTMDNLRNAFRDFLNRIPFYGLGVLCWDDSNVRRVFPELKRKSITYGFSESAELCAHSITLGGAGSRFSVRSKKESFGEFFLNIPGRHNVQNALAAIAVGRELGISPPKIAECLAEFRGVARRFESHGPVGNIAVFDDYGHHPTEIRTTLETARTTRPGGRILVLFQPHRFTRTKLLADEFGGAFEKADMVFITDIYAASETPINGVSGETIAGSVRRKGHLAVTCVGDWKTGVEKVLEVVQDGDTILTMGAGDIDQAPAALVREIKSRMKGKKPHGK